MTEPLSRLQGALAERYRIERELGAGGTATVYLAHDLRHHRKVALKLLREALSASLGKERFLREIKVAAALQHPHILPLYDSGAVDDLLYYVMPYVDGFSLRERLVQGGELPIGEAVRILRDVADALSEAHRHGVVHRDLKPENVMLRGRHALVMDFGVAKALSEATGAQSLTTVVSHWAHRPTWPRNRRWPTPRSTIEPISTPSACWPTSWSRRGRRSLAPARNRCSRRT